MGDFLKKYIWKNIWSVAFFLIGIPVIAYLLSAIPLLPAGGNNDWAGFWGGYLGAIIGAVVALYVLQETQKGDKIARAREEKVNYFNNLTVIWSELALATYDFLMYMQRYEAEKNKKDSDLNNIVENIYSENNKMVVLTTQLEILLETRKEVYDVKDIHKNVEEFEENLEEVFDSFLSVKKVKFANEDKNEYLYSKQDELENRTKMITKKIKQTVMKNLY